MTNSAAPGWDEIKEYYDRAAQCFWNVKKENPWARDEDNGTFYMWCAYHYASELNRKSPNHLLFARILRMVASEARIERNVYERYRKYVRPALEEYDLAASEGNPPSKKEYSYAKIEADNLDYIIRHESSENIWKEEIALIENGALLDEKHFCFHDSKPVYFEQISDLSALLVLNYDHLLAVFRFDNVDSISIHTDPVTNWVFDFCCYKVNQSAFLSFTAGDYHIVCQKITLEKLVDFDEYSKPDNGAFFWSKKLHQLCCQPTPTSGHSYNQRLKKAREMSQKKPASVERIIRLTNEILTADGIQPVLTPIVTGKKLEAILKCWNSLDGKVAYETIAQGRCLPEHSDLIWMKFTTSGHLGVIAAGADINFDTDAPSGYIHKLLGLDWDESFVLAFPIIKIAGVPALRKYERDQIETAVGNYLIANKIPVLDYYSHNYHGLSQKVIFHCKRTPGWIFPGVRGGKGISVYDNGMIVEEDYSFAKPAPGTIPVYDGSEPNERCTHKDDPTSCTILAQDQGLSASIKKCLQSRKNLIDDLPENLNNGTLEGSHDEFSFDGKRVSAWTIQRIDVEKIKQDNPEYYKKFKDNINAENAVLDICAAVEKILNRTGYRIKLPVDTGRSDS